MAKLLGYILMLLGIALIVGKFLLKTFFDKIPFLSILKPAYVIITGLVLIALGFLLRKGKKGKIEAGAEVPIYQGNKIVGYRRR